MLLRIRSLGSTATHRFEVSLVDLELVRGFFENQRPPGPLLPQLLMYFLFLEM
jgi:hypothetical protein